MNIHDERTATLTSQEHTNKQRINNHNDDDDNHKNRNKKQVH